MKIRQQLWDTSGNERFGSLIPSYVRDSSAALIVFDVGDQKSFDDIDIWIGNVRQEVKMLLWFWWPTK